MLPSVNTYSAPSGPSLTARIRAVQLGQQTLLADDALAVQHEPDEILRRPARHEQVALPRRKQLPGVEADACRRDVGRPEIHRLLHAGLQSSCRR